MATECECPPQGIYQDVPFAVYAKWPAISNSSLSAAMRSMAHYKARQPVEETSAMRLGSLCHAGKFEPLLIAQRYVVMPPFENQVRKPNGDLYDSPKATKDYKSLVAEFRAINKDKVIVTEDEYNTMLGVVSALSKNSKANSFLAQRENTAYEVSIVWQDAETGLMCKGRVDCMQPDLNQVGDLKTTVDASRFSETIARRSYHRQAAFYLDGLNTIRGDDYEFTLTVVETVLPYCVMAAHMSAEAINAGREEYGRLLAEIAEAKLKNVWPGYESPEVWELPAWAAKDNEEVELIIGGNKVRL